MQFIMLTTFQSVWLQPAQGLTTLAELACDGDFYAVLNLIRRNVVSYREVRDKFDGRNVLEWSRFYENDLLAKELLFRYVC